MIASGLVLAAATLLAAWPLASLVRPLRRLEPQSTAGAVNVFLCALTALALALTFVDWTLVPHRLWWAPTALLAASAARIALLSPELPRWNQDRKPLWQRAAALGSLALASLTCAISALAVM